ncbi:MAG: BNR-4 repeat-containing protein [Armatimonadota bacterium]
MPWWSIALLLLAAPQRPAADVTVAFSLDQGFGNGAVVQGNLRAVRRIVQALKPLQSRYRVCVIVNPMVADREKFDAVLDALACDEMPFVLDVYTSDALTLGSCSEQNRPYDPRHGISVSLEDLESYKKRYQKWFIGIRFAEVFAQDFTVRAVKTTNPEWALPCWKLPSDSYFRADLAEKYLRFARREGLFVQWSDWHWYEFADWDKPQESHEAELAGLLKKYPGLVTITYANNEPQNASAGRLAYWERAVAKFLSSGAAGYGLSNQSWLCEDEQACPIEDIIEWTKSALERGCRLIQFEPVWYFFDLPRGTFQVPSSMGAPSSSPTGEPTSHFHRLFEVLMTYPVQGKEDSYRGIWYSNQPSGDRYGWKYSGGMAVFCAKHLPMAIYLPKAGKTFFVYGGSPEPDSPDLLIMASWYDHRSGRVPRPTIVMRKKTGGDRGDAHHNPTLALDDRGYVWVFAPSHGRKDAFIYRSTAPFSTDAFQRVVQKEFSYPQPFYHPGFGFLFLFTKYTAGRELYFSTSPDGVNWSEDQKIAGFGGHYQVSWAWKHKRGVAFDFHPPGVGLNGRTNLYYVETRDFGKTWTNAAGCPVKIPLDSPANEALVHDYQAEKRLVYVKDLNFDADGHPVILYVVSKGYESGPKNGLRFWKVAHWTGNEWDIRTVTTSDHNYDTGSLWIEDDGTWRIIAPTEPGPQPWGCGGEIVIWSSTDQGKTWQKARQVTRDSKLNHNNSRRPVGAHPDFYTIWCDGNPFEHSECRLYFANKSGDRALMLPEKMAGDFAEPLPLRPRTADSRR